MWIMFAVIAVIVFIVLGVMRRGHMSDVTARFNTGVTSGSYDETDREEVMANNQFPLPKIVNTMVGWAAIVFLVIGSWSSAMFYAQPGYQYHVRDIMGMESHVTKMGWNWYGFGDITAWKLAMSLQATQKDASADTSGGDRNRDNVSVELGPQQITFLDQVDGRLEAMVRIKTPTDDLNFYKLVHEYRTPYNFMNTALIPAFRETAKANAQLMTAEEYFSGSQTVFMSEFEDQMINGRYEVKRIEKTIKIAKRGKGSANIAKGTDQSEFGEDTKTITIVQKIIDPGTGLPKRNLQKFLEYGVTVVEARVMDMVPNQKFQDRMIQKQDASAKRAVAREQRLEEEEKRLLAIAAGERAVAERQAEEKQKQIVATTKAETTKQLALTEASQFYETAKIQDKTAKVILNRDKTTAKSVVVLADANAYDKAKILAADGYMEKKLATLVKINDKWAMAFQNRNVPQSVTILGGGNSGGIESSDSSAKTFMDLMNARNAKALSLDMTVKQGANTVSK